ncbi:hypothetical protein N657DRAFT_454914 [Parathielavia appendiculata]|uniref:Uncharacterized protein n=1 Tax=Parathielavia appendiculata TaxID=2587402 RepID=A0AAN6Z409_9PEZI|nr:hypothetical protein N657DRAFT_454914 [Parathielavia appendiculata]
MSRVLTFQLSSVIGRLTTGTSPQPTQHPMGVSSFGDLHIRRHATGRPSAAGSPFSSCCYPPRPLHIPGRPGPKCPTGPLHQRGASPRKMEPESGSYARQFLKRAKYAASVQGDRGYLGQHFAAPNLEFCRDRDADWVTGTVWWPSSSDSPESPPCHTTRHS